MGANESSVAPNDSNAHNFQLNKQADIKSLPVLDWSIDRPLTSLVSGSIIPLNEYQFWDALLTKPVSAEDASSAVEAIESFVAIKPFFHTLGGITQPLIPATELQLVNGSICSSVLICCSFRNEATLTNLIIAMTRCLYRFCDQGVYESVEGIVDLEGCDRLVVWMHEMALCLAITPLESWGNVKNSFADVTAKDIIQCCSQEQEHPDYSWFSSPVNEIRPAWNQYTNGSALYDFFLCSINVLLFARNYTIPSSWVDPFNSSTVLQYHIPDEARAWAFGIGCKCIESSQHESVLCPQGLRLDGVTPDIWLRRTRLLKVLMVCVSEPFNYPISHWGFDTLERPSVTFSNTQSRDGVHVRCPELIEASLGGSVTLTANLAVTIMGMVEFSLLNRTSEGHWFNSSEPPYADQQPVKDCVLTALTIWGVVIGIRQDIFTPSGSSSRPRNVYPAILQNVADMIICNEMKGEAVGNAIKVGRLGDILKALGRVYHDRVMTYTNDNSVNNLEMVVEMALILMSFLKILPYSKTAEQMPSFITDMLFVNSMMVHILAAGRGCLTKPISNDSGVQDALFVIIHLQWRISALSESVVCRQKMNEPVSQNDSYWLTTLKRISPEIAADIPRHDLTVGECLLLLCLSKLIDFASRMSRFPQQQDNPKLFELQVTITYNLALATQQLKFVVADRFLSMCAIWFRFTVIMFKPFAPKIVEDMLKVLIALVSENKRKQPSTFRNPYGVYALLRRSDEFKRISEYTLTADDHKEEKNNFRDNREFLRWRDTLKPLRYINEIIFGGGELFILSIDEDETPETIVKSLRDGFWHILKPVLAQSQRLIDYGESTFNDPWFFAVHGKILMNIYSPFPDRPASQVTEGETRPTEADH
eukprot:GHVH01004945.1.p1 GENE.GHVH01004945.1~~GHVH01004945.1.p1  ORF type:complete len:892 (+),score=89.27 GHVH01004945.1:51-2678(+)